MNVENQSDPPADMNVENQSDPPSDSPRNNMDVDNSAVESDMSEDQPTTSLNRKEKLASLEEFRNLSKRDKENMLALLEEIAKQRGDEASVSVTAFENLLTCSVSQADRPSDNPPEEIPPTLGGLSPADKYKTIRVVAEKQSEKLQELQETAFRLERLAGLTEATRILLGVLIDSLKLQDELEPKRQFPTN